MTVDSADSAQNLALIDGNAMTLGAVTTTGTVDIAAVTNDLTLTGAVSTANATASAVKLNAGKNATAGSATMDVNTTHTFRCYT